MNKDEMFISANYVKAYLKKNVQVYMILANLKVEIKVFVSDITLVKESPKVFVEVSS